MLPEPDGIMMAVFIDDVTELNAPLLASPGSHHEGLIPLRYRPGPDGSRREDRGAHTFDHLSAAEEERLHLEFSSYQYATAEFSGFIEDETVADEVDTVEGESEAEAVAAAAGGAGSETVPGSDQDDSGSSTAETDELDEVEGRRAGGNDPDIDEDSVDEDAPMEERDPDEAEANVGDDTVRETGDENEDDQ